jgi:hypothetical protein
MGKYSDHEKILSGDTDGFTRFQPPPPRIRLSGFWKTDLSVCMYVRMYECARR